MVPGRGRISPQAVPGVDTVMQHTGEAPLIAVEVGLAAVTVLLMGYLRPVWHFFMFVGTRRFCIPGIALWQTPVN